MSDDLRNALKKLLSEPPNILNKEIWIWGLVILHNYIKKVFYD